MLASCHEDISSKNSVKNMVFWSHAGVMDIYAAHCVCASSLGLPSSHMTRPEECRRSRLRRTDAGVSCLSLVNPQG